MENGLFHAMLEAEPNFFLSLSFLYYPFATFYMKITS